MINIVSNTIPFDAARSSNLDFWLKADKVNQPLGSKVITCYDQSMYQNDAFATYLFGGIDPSVRYAPTLTIKQGNIHPSLDFTPTADQKFLSVKRVLSSSKSFTTSMVISFNSLGGANIFSTVSAGPQLFISTIQLYLVWQTNFSLSNYSTSGFSLQKPYLFTITYTNSGDISTYVDGTLVFSTNNDVPLDRDHRRLTFDGFDGSLYEFLYFNEAISTSEIQKLHQYLNRKYSIF